MMFWNIFWLLYTLSTINAADVSSSIKYRYFDDFLSDLDSRDKAFLTGESLPDFQEEGSGEIGDEFSESGKSLGTLFPRTLPIRTGSLRSKEMSCCMLGQLAGEKGYHCLAKYYAARVQFRNYNRAHNKKIVALRPSVFNNPKKTPLRKTADKLMRTFEHCVTNWSNIFHKCCHLAAMEGDPKDKKQQNNYKKGR